MADLLPGTALSRAEAHAAGLSDAQIKHRVATGAWQRLSRGLYLIGPAPEFSSVTTTVIAAAMCRHAPDAVVTHESAAVVHGIATVFAPRVVQLAREKASGRRRQCVVRVADLPSDEVVTVAGLAVTSAARTVFDIARRVSLRAGVVAADSALHQRLVSPEDLQAMLIRHHTVPGVRRAGRAVALADARAETPIESLARVLCVERGLPTAEPQQLILTALGMVRVDLLLRGHRTIIETDGRLKYDDPATLWAEKQREDALRDGGYEVARLLWPHVTRHQDEGERRVRAAMRRAERRR